MKRVLFGLSIGVRLAPGNNDDDEDDEDVKRHWRPPARRTLCTVAALIAPKSVNFRLQGSPAGSTGEVVGGRAAATLICPRRESQRRRLWPMDGDGGGGREDNINDHSDDNDNRN